MKRLEYQLIKVEEIQEQYATELRMNDGARNIAGALGSQNKKNKENKTKENKTKENKFAHQTAKGNFKESLQNLCIFERELEFLMGNFSLQIRGVAGFARLCPGDIYEFSCKYGGQKWKAKGRVGAEKEQKWDLPTSNFKCLMGDWLELKISQARFIGKSPVLCEKRIDTLGLFAPHPQLMTVSLNPAGSLKLNLVITWK